MIAPLGAALFLAATAASSPAAGYWLTASPANAAETALRKALDDARGAPPDTAQALAAVSAAHKATVASGLAQLAAGLLLIDGGRPVEAEPFLMHPDVARTQLRDHAHLGLARAYEKMGDFGRAAASYRTLLDSSPTALRCTALVRGADLQALVGRFDEAVSLLDRALASCQSAEPQVLLQLGLAEEKRGYPPAAAAALDRLDRDHPASLQARQAGARLRALARYLPAATPEEKLGRDLKKGLVLFEAGHHAEAIRVFRALLAGKPTGPNADVIRVRLGRALLALGKEKEAQVHLKAVSKRAAVEPEAAYHLARIQGRRQKPPRVYETVADRHPGTSWAEEALLDLAHHFAKDARDREALPYFRRLMTEYPRGRYVDRATWQVAWADYRGGRFQAAAELMEGAARQRPRTSMAPGFLYWAARARREMGQEQQARALFEETVRRYKHAYHGLKARDALGQLSAGASTTNPAPPETPYEIVEPHRTQVRQLLLIDRLDEAAEELKLTPGNPRVQATIAWIHWRRGRLRPGITAMKRAYPEYIGEAGEGLPEGVWRILFPLGYAEALQAEAAAVGIDAALLAGLISQESTFDPTAVSAVGARGLMQLMIPTGRGLARAKGLKFRPEMLYDPAVSLTLGARYFRQVLDRYGGRVERALAAYNAGPTRVSTWAAARPRLTAEEFVESIPFPETRTYVMTILASREHYHRIYGLR